jgi:O-antigen/teichoic acid export membrane protein
LSAACPASILRRFAGLPQGIVSSHPILHRFLTNISWNFLGKICAQALLFAVSVVLTRYLGKERYGIYASLLVIPAVLRLLISFGLETVINKKLPELAIREHGPEQARYVLRTLLLLRAASVLTVCLLAYNLLPFYFSWIGLPELSTHRTVILYYFTVISLQSVFSTMFMTYLQYKTTAVMETVSALLNLALLAFFIHYDGGIEGVLYAFIVSTGVTLLGYLYLARPYVEGPVLAVDWSDSRRLARMSYWISLFSFGLMTQSDVVLMNYFHVLPQYIGFYQLATGISSMLAFTLTGIGPLALSLFSETYARDSSAGLSRSWNQILGFTVFCLTPLYIFVLFNSQGLIEFIYGPAFAPASRVLSLYLVFAFTGAVLGGGLVASALHVVGASGQALRVIIEGSILNILLDVLLIPPFREMGAATATGSVMVYMALRQLWVLHRHIDVSSVFPFVAKCLSLSLAATLPCLGLSFFGVNSLVLNFVVFALVFVLVLGWVKPLREEHLLVARAWPEWAQKRLAWFVR